VPLLLLLASCTTTGTPSVAPAVPGVPVGGTLRVGITTPAGVDPGNAYEPMSDLIARTLCDPLISADPKTGTLRSSLVSTWVISDNGQRLVLRLRKGIRFSDGSRVRADDVAFSLSRIASADYAGAAAERLSAIDGYAQIHGDDDAASDRDRKRLRGVRVLDGESLEITLVRRQADFLRLLTSPLVTPLSRKASEHDPRAFAAKPVCSGPYALTAPYQPGNSVITLARVPGHVAVDASLTRGGAGYADRIEFRISPDPASLQRAGQVDVAAADPSDTARVVEGPGPLLDYVGFPTNIGPANGSKVVRHALALALNRTALVAAVYPRTRTVATGFLPPTTLPVFGTGCTDLPVSGDVPRARQLLSALNINLADQRVKYLVNDDGRNVALAKAVAAQWKSALGLTATVTPVPFDAYLTQVGRSTGPFRFSWSTPYADPDGMLFPLFATDRIGKDNASRYSNPDFDRTIVRQAREAPDAADRQLEYRHAEQLLCADLPMVPLTFSLSRYLVADGVKPASVWVDRTNGQPLLRELSARTP
jgi:oligopeptide transport system substrate-binding protein